MSGTRLTRKVTVEGGKKLPEGGGQSSSSSSGTRRSVFDRLGPGTSERSRPRESYPPEKCRNWLRDGRCQFGRNCKFLHGPFSEPKQRTKSVRSIVRSDVDRSEERDESVMGSRTRSLDSIGDEYEEKREIRVKRKKHRPEDAVGSSKKSEKVQRRHEVEKASSEGDEESVDESRKRKKKLKKRSLSGVVVTKQRSPEQEERDWGDEEFDEGRSDLEWEERGELDFERQLNLEKRRQDLQRQLALMDEEEAAREKAERKGKEIKKEKEEDHKPVIPVVHSKLHPEKSSISPRGEVSPVSSQSTPKKKKKKTEGESKKAKMKRKLSPSGKELKKRKSARPAAVGTESDTMEERTRKESSPETSNLMSSRTQRQIEISSEEKPRGIKKKQVKSKSKENRITKTAEEARAILLDPMTRRPQQSLPEENIQRDRRSYSPEEQRAHVEKVRRRAAVPSPEGSDSLASQNPRGERSRRVTDSSDSSPRKPVGDVQDTRPPVEVDYKMTAKGYDKRYRVQESPSTPESFRTTLGKETRHLDEERTARRKVVVDDQPPPPRSPSPEDIPQPGPVTPPPEQRRHRTPPRGDRRGPQTPPGEPDFDNDLPKHVTNERVPPRRRGPYTPPPPPPPPPPPTTPPVRSRTEKDRDEFYEGRPVSYRDVGPRTKGRDERDTRHPKVRDEERDDDLSRGSRGHPAMEEDVPRNRMREEEPGRGRKRDDRQEDHHQRGRAKDDRADDFQRVRDREPERSDDHHRGRPEDPRADEFSRRKPEGDDEYYRRRDERDDDHSRARNRELEREDERQRRKDEHPRGRPRDDHEDEQQRPRDRGDVSRRQFEGGDERYWEAPRGERDSREGQFAGRDRRRPDIQRQEFPDISRGRERPGERPRDRDGRHPPPGPEYHRRGPSPTPHGPPRRSPPPHGPPRGPHRFMERRRSLSPGGRREEGYRQGPPRDQGGYGMGREPGPGRVGYSTPFDDRGRPLDSRRRNSPPPRQYAERGRGAPRPRGSRGGRGLPDRMRPPGDRYQEPPRDRGGPWESERRREREHPRERNRPPDEARDSDRKPRGEQSPGRGPRQWEERRAGSPGRVSSPPRDRRAHEQEKIPRDLEEERRRRSADEDEWEYEEDISEGKGDKAPRTQGERKRPRETTSAVSTPESFAGSGGKRHRSETPETEQVALHDVLEKEDKGDKQEVPSGTGIPTNTEIPAKQISKVKKKKAVKREGKVTKTEGEDNLEDQAPQETPLEGEAQVEGEKLIKGEKKARKEKGKNKEKGTKKKKKSSTALVEAEAEVAKELTDAPTILQEGDSLPSENLGEGAQSQAESEPVAKAAKKRRHVDLPEEEEVKVKGTGEKPPKKKKKKKHQPEVVFQPWADLEGEDEDTKQSKSESAESQENSKDKRNDPLKSSDEKLASSKVDAPVVVFSDWSDDSPIGDDAWSDVIEMSEIPDEKPKVSEKEPERVSTPVQNAVPAYDDVYDPISDDELDAMLGDEEEGTEGKASSTGTTSTPMPVEDVDWSALVSSHAPSEKTGEEPGSHLKRFTPGHVFSRIGISSSLAGPRLTNLVLQACAEATNDNRSGLEAVESNDVDGASGSQGSVGALMAGAAAKKREREMLFTKVGPCRRALCARKDLAMRKRLRRLTGKIGLFQTPSSAPVDNELYLMSVALYKHEQSSSDSSVTKLIPSRVGSVLTTVTS